MSMSVEQSKVEKGFHEAMIGIYESAKRLRPPYPATRFIRMVHEHGGKETADRLLATSNPSEGFTELFLRGRDHLKISVEYVVLQNPWRELFTEEQLEIARKRLRDHGCDLPPENEM
jgi:hypothetical protein